MVIDDHVHLGQLRHGQEPLTASRLLRQMDKWGVDKAVVLSVENPEEVDLYVPTRDILRMCRRHRDRLFPFCNIDPRRRYPGHFDPTPMLEDYIGQGCQGFGENLAGIPVDDPMNQVLYEACGKLGLPLMMHFDYWINRDEPGMPNFEKMLRKYPATVFMAHGPNFWREISKNETDPSGYPTGKVRKGGRVDKLLAKYPNLYGDLSAGSGHNAIARDPNFGPAFLERNQDKLLFGTDYLTPKQECPLVAYFQDPPVPKQAVSKIMGANAQKLLGL